MIASVGAEMGVGSGTGKGAGSGLREPEVVLAAVTALNGCMDSSVVVGTTIISFAPYSCETRYITMSALLSIRTFADAFRPQYRA